LLVAVLATGVASAAPVQGDPGVIYAAFNLLGRGKLNNKRCGPYSVTSGTWTAPSASPDPRLAGNVTLQAKIAYDPDTGLGFTRGTLRIRDRRGTLRLSSSVFGVNSNKVVVNGIVTGNLFRPNALLLANVTMVFNENFTFAPVRLGLEDGRNSAIAYSPLNRGC
jgi:hypothetical protein